ncbi:MAG: glutamate--tRNA ligase, partial [Paracoccus sp. (in: a-proteobacteria)]
QPVRLASLDELAAEFDLSQFGASPTKFDAEDLWPLTREKNQALPLEAVADRIAALGVPAEQAERFWRVASQNITVLDDLAGWWRIFSEGAEPQIDPDDAEFVVEAMKLLPPPPYTETTWDEWTTRVKQATGRKGKGLFMPLRKAVTGQAHGPEMAEVMPLLQVVRARG